MIFKSRLYYSGPKSDHFDGKRFFLYGKPHRNNLKALLRWRLFGKRHPWPKRVSIPHAPEPEVHVREGIKVTCIGHATLLIQADGLNILTDPHFFPRASPLSWLGPKRCKPPGLKLSQLPRIDIVFVSHNHYDHLDIPTLRWLWKRYQPRIITPLGNDVVIHKAAPEVLVEVMDWHQMVALSPHSSLKLLPCQHWSSRTPFDVNWALWGAAFFTFGEQTMLFVGDTGFSDALFKQLRHAAPAPNIVALPMGSYEPRWFMRYVHMGPEDAWKAFTILGGQTLIPTHYDVFPLGDEPFGDALKRLKESAGEHWDSVAALEVGQSFASR